MNATEILNVILSQKTANGISETKAITEVAKDLNLARGTITRWLKLENVPQQYTFDLMKMAGMEIDYSQFSDKEKDQFFTILATVRKCYEIFTEKMSELGFDTSEHIFIEPSAGSGAFLEVLPEGRTLAFDIEPKNESVIEQDFLSWTPQEDKKYIVFGNPPFGLRGHLALAFINHSYKFADFVCFILPQLFESDGKGSPRKRIDGYNLILSEKIDNTFVFPNQKEVKVNVIFQILSKHHENKEFDIYQPNNKNINVYSLSNGETPSQQRNVDMIDKCDMYLPSTCFGKQNMRSYDNFNDLPNLKGYGITFQNASSKTIEDAKNIQWSDVSFQSTNSAYNLRKNKILEALENRNIGE